MMRPRCGFLRDDGTGCTNPAVEMALVEEIGAHVPCCDDCGAGRQAARPKDAG